MARTFEKEAEAIAEQRAIDAGLAEAEAIQRQRQRLALDWEAIDRRWRAEPVPSPKPASDCEHCR